MNNEFLNFHNFFILDVTKLLVFLDYTAEAQTVEITVL